MRGFTGWTGVVPHARDVADALAVGARLHGHQPQDEVRVMLDPARHRFCVYQDAGA